MESTPKHHSPARNAVRAAYPGKLWQERVDKMTDNQIVAVYMRLKLKGKIK